jgi:hypothetical protein
MIVLRGFILGLSFHQFHCAYQGAFSFSSLVVLLFDPQRDYFHDTKQH